MEVPPSRITRAESQEAVALLTILKTSQNLVSNKEFRIINIIKKQFRIKYKPKSLTNAFIVSTAKELSGVV